MTNYDSEARARIARGWSSTPLSQADYAAQFGVSPRTLRSWVERYGAGERPATRARAIIDRAIEQLVALKAALEAEEACQVGSGEGAAEDADMAEPQRHAEVADVAATVPVLPAPSPLQPMPMPGAGFWG